MKSTKSKACLKSFQQLIRLPLMFTNGGFTLIEILVTVLIIGILGAIALPQYQRAVLKSRYSGMMPIAKALAEGNEVYYLDHGEYSENPADLLVAGRDKNAGAYPDGTRVLMYDEDGLSYVRVTNDNVPNARYLVYQKHSENFPDTTQCEAADDRANELCQALGGELIEGGNSSGETKWTAYLLSGRYGSEDQLIPANNDNSGDENEGGEGNEGGDEPGENSGTEPEPQTPSKPTCGGVEQPDDILPTETNTATGTAKCINNKWVYEWTGGNVYDTDRTGESTVCTGDSKYKCSGAEFKGMYNQCEATQVKGCEGSTFSGRASVCKGTSTDGCANSTFSGQFSYCNGVANACADSTFSGQYSRCQGYYTHACEGSTFSGEEARCYGSKTNACANSIFSGQRSYCTGNASNACADSTFSGKRSYCGGAAANGCAGSTFSGEEAHCNGGAANACAGTTIQAGAYCYPDASGGCDGAKYGADPNGQRKGIGSCDNYYGYCPTGVPLKGSWNSTNGSYNYTWKGNCCNPAYMVSGECPSGIAVCS